MIRKILICSFIFVATSSLAKAQRDLDYDQVVVPQNRIDARDLGYAPVDVIPHGEDGVTALTVAPNGNLYGATSGKRSHLFVFDPRHGYVQPLGYLPNTTAVTNAIVVSKEGDVYVGASPGGHLLKYSPSLEDQQPLRVKEPCQVTDLGPAVKGEGILALVIDREAGVIHGLSYPYAHFFSFTIATGITKDFGVVALHAPHGEKSETEKMVSRMLAMDLKGNVYASGEDGFLFKFDKEKQVLTRLPMQLPGIPGREPWSRVDTFLTAPSGLIFGGTSDGYLFRFDPDACKVDNLGKPLLQYRITGLALGSSGKIYGVGGDKDDLARMFSYDPQNGTYEILGFIDVNRRPYYAWQAYVIGAMVAGPDGTMYIGENERISKLYLFYPW
jgi:hypothetical protein